MAAPEAAALDRLRERTAELLREDADRAARLRHQTVLAEIYAAIKASESSGWVSADVALRRWCGR